jgi:hypothetical protein
MFGKKIFDKIINFTKKSNSINVLHNRLILYFLLFISIINLTFNGLMGNFLIPTLFILIGIVISFFNKNMIVILTISLISSNIIEYGTKLKYNEGMEIENEEETKKDKKKKDEKSENVIPYEKKKEDTSTVANNKAIEGMQEQYKDLMELQDKILGNFESLEESLTTAENLVKNIGKAIPR